MNRSFLVPTRSREETERLIHELGPWFQNINLDGVYTAPDHFLGDYPTDKWNRFSHVIPDDLTGKAVLDIGCNAGFYSLEMKRRGAGRVLGIDFDPAYLAQARFAAEVTGLNIEFRKMSVYDVASLHEQFDIVLFMGVLYHLRHPLLALDLVREHVVRDTMIFQSMQRGSDRIVRTAADYSFEDRAVFNDPGYPAMYFIEDCYAGDPTNWWIPNRACAEALLRSAGFEIVGHPEEEVYVCKPGYKPAGKNPTAFKEPNG
jgi:tRNA (mo5U34)-methyltransferase